MHGQHQASFNHLPVQKGTWIENLAIRSNGKILVTLLSAPEVWQIDPVNPGPAELIYRFPQALSALGIAEVQPDVFAVAVGNITVETIASTPGSYSAWLINLSQQQQGKQAKCVSKITDLPQAAFLNGVSVLSQKENVVLLADSAQGLIYQLNAQTGASKIWLDDPALKPNNSIAVKSGINGLRVHEGYAYFTNTFSSPVLGRVQISSAGGPAGPVQTIVGQPPYETNIGDHADDFTFDSSGNVWLATNPSNSIVKIESGGRVSVEVGGVDDSTVAGVTALAFGRTSRDRKALYATTNGGIAYPPPSGAVGGKVLAVNLDNL
ncbi:Putative six-bladed beta-propeller, TolB [Septoria linicola]|uniref:Six-bladed beta-propeller, TolB n=1 Tax=Septoria linicola TaxID=215465 RepID=A0A9Q9B937_9PEZI|nr:Putative six-bladed beta-propeller, TolB [Septoria linicola]